MRTDRLVREYDLEPQHIMFPLHPEVPAAGMALRELFRGREDQLELMSERLHVLMEQEGLPYGERTHTYNSRLAQELAKWADSVERGSGIHDALYRAYFVDNTNLAEVEALIEIGKSVGFIERDIRTVLHERTFRDAVDRDWSLASEMGVTGVPTFVIGPNGVVGVQPYEILEELARAGGATKSTQ